MGNFFSNTSCIKCGDPNGKDGLHCREHGSNLNNICVDCNNDLSKYHGGCYHTYSKIKSFPKIKVSV